MNVLHMKYAVEVAKYGSINKAAQELYIAQPNLSRCIKELEADLGITIFNRTFRGMTLTPEGEEFIEDAKKVLDEIDNIEKSFKSRENHQIQRFSLSTVRAAYISSAFCDFSKELDFRPAEIIYHESDSAKVVNAITENDFRLGIIRINSDNDKYVNDYLDKRGLIGVEIAEFEQYIVYNKNSHLSSINELNPQSLGNYFEIISEDFLSLPPSKIKYEDFHSDKKLYISSRTAQFEMLNKNINCYMFSAPAAKSDLKKYGLSGRKISDKKFKDILVRKKDYKLTSLDKRFIEMLKNSQI